jgi:hypothetical protein
VRIPPAMSAAACRVPIPRSVLSRAASRTLAASSGSSPARRPISSDESRASRNASVSPARSSRPRASAVINGSSATRGVVELTVQWSMPTSTRTANATDGASVAGRVRGASTW